MVIIPRPPICIRHNITIFPKNVKYEPVSTTANPVTHAAEVAVNMESVHDNESILLFSEKCKRIEPIKMMKPKKIMGKMIGEPMIFILFTHSYQNKRCYKHNLI
jgi:hypothetical protein